MRLSLLTLLLLVSGCVERTLTIRTDPPEALLYLNGVEVGRTPYRRDFVFYGTYDVEVRKEGYETLKARGPVIAPWWQWPPIDLLADLAPLRFHDRQLLTYTLRPSEGATVAPQEILNRGQAMRTNLESSSFTRSPATQQAKPPSAPAATR